MIEIRHYVTPNGKDVFAEWFHSLKDRKVQAIVATRLDRLVAGNVGDAKPVGQGVYELRIDHGPGYRVYYAIAGQTLVLLLCAGDKRRQSADISRAVEFWNEYQRRSESS